MSDKIGQPGEGSELDLVPRLAALRRRFDQIIYDLNCNYLKYANKVSGSPGRYELLTFNGILCWDICVTAGLPPKSLVLKCESGNVIDCTALLNGIKADGLLNDIYIEEKEVVDIDLIKKGLSSIFLMKGQSCSTGIPRAEEQMWPGISWHINDREITIILPSLQSNDTPDLLIFVERLLVFMQQEIEGLRGYLGSNIFRLRAVSNPTSVVVSEGVNQILNTLN